MLRPPLSGEVGRVTQVSQGGVPSASAQPQCYIRDPIWPPAETHTQEHLMGLGQIWGTAVNGHFYLHVRWSPLVLLTAHHGFFPRFGVTGGLTCQSTTSELHCWMTANTAIQSTRTQWHYPCELPHCSYTKRILQMVQFSNTKFNQPVHRTVNVFVLDWEHPSLRTLMLTWGLTISPMQSCHTQVLLVFWISFENKTFIRILKLWAFKHICNICFVQDPSKMPL